MNSIQAAPTKYNAQRAVPSAQEASAEPSYVPPLREQLAMNALRQANVLASMQHFARLLRGLQREAALLEGQPAPLPSKREAARMVAAATQARRSEAAIRDDLIARQMLA